MPLTEYMAGQPPVESAETESSSDDIPVSDETNSPALLPVEKLTPPQPLSETVVVEHAVYRCEKGNGLVFVDEDNKKKFSKCSLFKAEKTAEVPLLPQPSRQMSDDSCSGRLRYRGNTYIFYANEPCPIPTEVFLQRLPVNP